MLDNEQNQKNEGSVYSLFLALDRVLITIDKNEEVGQKQR